MKKLLLGLGAALVLAATAAPALASAPARGFVIERPALRSQSGQPHVIGHPEMVARYAVVPARNVNLGKALDDAKTGKTIPFWNGSFTYNKTNYNYMMVGTDPITGGTTSHIPTEIFAYALTFSNGMVFDPTKVNSACDTESAVERLKDSPLFVTSSITENGVNVGKVGYEDAEMRGEFWKYASSEPKYHVIYKNGKTAITVVDLTVPAADGKTVAVNGFCGGSIGEVDINWLANEIATTTWKTTEVPVVYLYNVFQTESGECCVLGYHGAYETSGSDLLQTYSVTAYNNPGIFSATGIQDIHATSHEFGELLNDPTGNNIVPAWGHIGQQSGCQNNLEVGDPLTGTVFGSGITTKGYLYHPQELVYYSWFSRDNPSFGAGGEYSMNGTFTSAQGVCT